MSFFNFTQILADASVDADESQYGDYVPSRAVSYIFVILFALSTLAHLGQGLYARMWWTIPTILLAGCLEVLGWSGRLWSSFSPTLQDPYMIQIVCTIIGPTPLVAANFIILGAIIRILGPMYSRLGPRNYSRVFLSCDIISLVVQGAGGGIAASASDLDGANLGGNIMLGGIVFQLVIIVLYSIMSTEFLFRYVHDRPVGGLKPASQSQATLGGAESRGEMDTKTKIMVAGLGFNILCLFIRAVYRTIELSDGWNGRVINTEVYFNVLDGAMVVLAMYTFNFAHPGHLIGRDMGKSLSKKDRSSLELETVQTGRV
ncbi:RTA1 like protein-domain-containing protein [Mucidula mucida]|nr:RTA1 like protein-domain-containing protein [Mucidula mucida]